MKALEISNLLQIGGQDAVRKYLKRLGLKDRMRTLHQCVPFINTTPDTLQFFSEHFSHEVGALIMAKYDYAKAEELYRVAKQMEM
jgi:hypothetical protein